MTKHNLIKQIVLSNAPVTLEAVNDNERDKIMSLDVRHSVLQKSEDLLPFVNPVSLEGAVRGEDVPLITVKITALSKTGETIIGISWNHILGMYAGVSNLTYQPLKW